MSESKSLLDISMPQNKDKKKNESKDKHSHCAPKKNYNDIHYNHLHTTNSEREVSLSHSIRFDSSQKKSKTCL